MYVYEENSMGNSIYLLSKGTCTSIKWGKIRLFDIKEGESFGEGGFSRSGGMNRFASISTVTYCDIKFISRKVFDKIAANTLPAFLVKHISKVLSERSLKSLSANKDLEAVLKSDYSLIFDEFNSENIEKGRLLNDAFTLNGKVKVKNDLHDHKVKILPTAMNSSKEQVIDMFSM